MVTVKSLCILLIKYNQFYWFRYGTVFVGLGTENGNPQGRLWIRNGTVIGTNFNLGISKNSNTLIEYNTANLLFNTIYLVVISYEIGTAVLGDDIVKLWVNPDLSGVEPTPSILLTDNTADDIPNIDGFLLDKQ